MPVRNDSIRDEFEKLLKRLNRRSSFWIPFTVTWEGSNLEPSGSGDDGHGDGYFEEHSGLISNGEIEFELYICSQLETHWCVVLTLGHPRGEVALAWEPSRLFNVLGRCAVAGIALEVKGGTETGEFKCLGVSYRFLMIFGKRKGNDTEYLSLSEAVHNLAHVGPQVFEWVDRREVPGDEDWWEILEANNGVIESWDLERRVEVSG